MKMNISENIIKVKNKGSGETMDYAAEELCRYIMLLSRDKKALISDKSADTDSLVIGTYSDIGMKDDDPGTGEFDDGFTIHVAGGKGTIAGKNPRSVLLAVYRFLEEAGCRWIRPGKDGDFIPETDISSVSVSIRSVPSYRHRGICIEGAASCENVRDIIEWMPKLGFNSYFLQFREAFTFFDRWYSHKNNPYVKQEPFDISMAAKYVKLLAADIKKRGIIHHAVGHGWTCEPFGIPGIEWAPYKGPVPHRAQKYFALIDNKRDLWQEIPLNTNLCYSGSKVRRIITDAITGYLMQHKEVDILHFWLADGSNNQCECPECRKALPSDFYVMMLNELAEQLDRLNLPTKIVFLIYVDLMWKPEKYTISDPDRFILMFAPITRSYSQSYDTGNDEVPLKLYVRNRLEFPKSVKENVGYLKEWQKLFKGDSFAFDYHMLVEYLNDPGQFQNAAIMYEDLRKLSSLKLNGYISCQYQRVFLPSGFNMQLMGKVLWDASVSFGNTASEYFRASFGEDGPACMKWLNELSRLFDPAYLRNEKPVVNALSAENLKKAKEKIDGFKETINRNLACQDPCQRLSWIYLGEFADIYSPLASALSARAEGNKETAASIWENLKERLCRNEDKIQPVLDLYEFINAFDQRFR